MVTMFTNDNQISENSAPHTELKEVSNKGDQLQPVHQNKISK